LEDLDKVKLTWEDFNANFDSSCPPYAEITEIVKVYYDKKIDLRPYMICRPFRVFENDSIQNVNELMRHMDLRTVPVIREADHVLVGVITRQDLFSYMSI
jgi:predicted transcriptional regulator